MRPLLYSINVTIDGCVDHSAGSTDAVLLEEALRATHHHAIASMGRADALLFGRVTYQMMEEAWRLETRTLTMPEWTDPFARTIDATRVQLEADSFEDYVSYSKAAVKKAAVKHATN